ncbi:acetyl-coenzyme A transporter 1-like [Ptychodera flava]|uniref:acetyl-coenzyme A transporter 1-like n=1 Tax=Ptychodera flava TaxID=63121 RepID=UPI00396A9406
MPRKRKIPSSPVDQTTLDSELLFPHAPLASLPERRKDRLDSEETGDAETESESESDSMDGGRGLNGDKINIAVLLFLYVLQGIPLGLAGSIPMVLQSRHIGYKQQAMFSFVYWPFSVKLMWAPIVDALYSTSFGRRKSWLVPTQYLIGIFMIVLSQHVTDLLGNGEEDFIPDVFTLTVTFFMLNFLAATQDIAVDGWALTMLSRRNVGYASTCNTVGQTAGYFLGNVLFLALESSDFCNKYLRSEPLPYGIVTLSGFLYFWGFVFLITTSLVWWFKREKAEPSDDTEPGIIGTYKLLISIVQLPSVKAYIVILMTCKIGFSATDAATGLKLIEHGVPKERLALLAIPLIPLQIVLPWIISKYTAGPRPMDVFVKAIPYRLFMGIVLMLIVWWTPSFKSGNDEFPWYYYGLVMVCYGLHQITLYCMFVGGMAFHAKISDPAIGGTYMTLLNTLSNLGGNWPSTMALWFVDNLTWKSCIDGQIQGLDCDSKMNVEECTKAGGHCVTDFDGYYIEVIICFFIGFLWLLWKRKTVLRLQELDESAWKCT